MSAATDQPLVLYHANCWDGFAAAWAFHRVHPDAEFQPVQYGQRPPDVAGREVYILDFSYPREVLLEMHQAAKSLLVLDHHKTAEAELAGLDFCEFDLNRSGGRLAWERFIDRQPPWLITYTEDRDLWRWALRCSREINAALRTLPLDFASWDDLHTDPDAAERLATEGAAILRAEQVLIRAHVAQAAELEIDGHQVRCVNATVLASEIAGELAKDRPFGVVWFEGDNNERVYQLRSQEGGVDVSTIAKRHGGGGHARAAGFRAPATGATGLFSHGRASDHDEGDLRLAISCDRRKGLVNIDLGTSATWLGITKDQARQFAALLVRYAERLP